MKMVQMMMIMVKMMTTITCDNRQHHDYGKGVENHMKK